MKQFLKAFAVLVAFIIATAIGFTLSQADIEVSTSLALEQFADPSIVTDTALRAKAGSMWLAHTIIWASFAMFALIVYRAEIKNGIQSLSRNEEV